MKLIEFMYDEKWFGLDVDRMNHFIWQEKPQILDVTIGSKRFVFKGEKAVMIYGRLQKALERP